MKILYYFDETGNPHIAEKIKVNDDKSLSLKYIHRGKSFTKKKVKSKKHAKIIKGLATSFYKIVTRPDPPKPVIEKIKTKSK